MQTQQETASAPAAVEQTIAIPSEGEERYAAMLARMKQGTPSPQHTVQIVPKINSQAAVPAPSTSRQELAAPQVDPYPKESIPLEIEKRDLTVRSESKPIAIERNLSPSGRYIVLRIERNQQGIPAALMMPIGGRQAIDSAWVFVGDATSDGMVIENITSDTVVMKAANGRSIQIALH
jgi:hypothetical protein